MIFKTAIAAAALGAMMLPASAILSDNPAGAADLQQGKRVCARCGLKPGARVYIEHRIYVERRYYPLYINADAYDAEYAREYWKGVAVSLYRPRPWYY
jgi:hypothetical protein